MILSPVFLYFFSISFMRSTNSILMWLSVFSGCVMTGWRAVDMASTVNLLFLKPEELSPAGHYKECRLKVLLHWLHFSVLDALSIFYSQ